VEAASSPPHRTHSNLTLSDLDRPERILQERQYQPPGFSVHERTNTRPLTTTAQIPMKRWSDRAPGPDPEDLALVDGSYHGTGKGRVIARSSFP
jgi:hypothetical protein